MSIRTFISRAFIAAGLLVCGWAANAQDVANPLSPHNLSTSGTGPGGAGTTTQVCVYCHTPHAGAIGAAVPLWNKTNSSVEGDFARYSTLGTVTFESQEADVGSVSMACLSCHDGAQSMDVVINAPGSGLGTGNIDGGARLMGATTANLGRDLTNDHPISMQYAAGGITDVGVNGTPSQDLAVTYGDPDFKDPYGVLINGTTPVWWLDVDDGGVGAPGVRDKTDVLLYTRNDLGDVEPFVECGSCHDPHNFGSQSINMVAFLRVDNDASQICTACHIK